MLKTVFTIIIFSFFFLSCNKSKISECSQDNLEIIKINHILLTKEEFKNKYLSLHKTTNKPLEECKLETIESYIYNSCLIEYLTGENMILTPEYQTRLTIKNRNSLVLLSKKQLTKNIPVSEQEAQNELKRFMNKQIVIDLIFLQEVDNQLLNECYEFLESGGNITDMLYSNKNYFDRIISKNGKIERINVEPGMFPLKISKFISSADKEDVKLFKLKEKGNFLIKVLYSEADNQNTYNFEKVVLNLRIKKYLNENAINSIVNTSLIELEKLNALDLPRKYLRNDDSVLVKYEEKLYTEKEIKRLIAPFPFKYKLLFTNKSTLPHALTTLILQINNNKPVTSPDILRELGNNKSEEEVKLLFEYNYLLEYENSDIYPWLFPFLFENFDKVEVNTNLLEKTDLIKVNPVKRDAILAYSQSGSFSVSDFFSELDILSKESLWPIMEYNNAVRLIHYYFESTKNTKACEVNINHDILKKCLYYFNSKLSYSDYVYGLLSKPGDPRKKKTYDLNEYIFNNGEIALSIDELQSLIYQYPPGIKQNMRTDNFQVNRYWRVTAISKIIEDEFWIKKANTLKLSESEAYNQIIDNNYNKLLVNQFLNLNPGFKNEQFDSIVRMVFDKGTTKLTIDSLFFQKELPLLFDNNLLTNMIKRP